MTGFNPVRVALMDVLNGSLLFSRIKEDIDGFLRRYNVPDWLTLSQVATIHEILMAGDRAEVMKRLEGYKELQLRRSSDQDRWQRVVDGKKAIEYFYDMINGLLERHLPYLKEEIVNRFRLTVDESYKPLIYESLIKTIDYIFVTKVRILKDKEGSKCLKG